ncbi:MAG: ABC transporter ATP-binding protein [Promethearchaeota archaeon]
MPTDKDTMIRVIDVNKEYRRSGAIIHALVDVNLTIKSGDFVMVQGPTGCGKSTLLNVMSGLDLPDSGKIIFDGENIARAKEDRLSKLRRQKVGFVFQDYNLISTLTAMENIEALLWPTVLSSREIQNRAIAALRDVSMLERKDHYPVEMSGGEKQRVALARAIVSKPRVIFGDEVSGNLDPESEAMIMNLLKKINEEYETTMVIVTHRESVAKFGNVIVKMNKGKVLSVK